MAETSPLFSLEGVNQARGDVVILRDVAVEIPRTEITALIGPSGSGKTSFLRLLNRLDDPASGMIRFHGEPITAYPIAALRRRVGFVFQQPAMFSGTVADNLRIAVELGGREAQADPLPMDRVLAAVELSSAYADRDAARLSGGERQRVSIARALMTRPEVLLLDEPTSALDVEIADRLLSTIARLPREYGVSVVMVTHRLYEARDMSTWTVMLEAGSVVEAGPTSRLFTAAVNERTRAFLALAE
ncbi:MAG TPA: phosphate ABC transporter ATP-binding protein [Longimicrobiales bacterium]|nr:phosphate ABC transporter ATP-binding protein [Longimicrobiales bacterium]